MSSVSAAHATLQAFEKRDKREGSVPKKSGGRRANENFEKRKRSLLRKCNETVELYDADLYIAVRRKGKCTVYSSCFVSSWPPRQEDMETYYPVPIVMTPEDFRRETTDDREASSLGEKGGFFDEPTSSRPAAKSSVVGVGLKGP
ncbi:uncharacterized protein PV06_05409 [Exophiala oligosperma]|uniref:MADS-box domain-containing protein n=2 Tax=Exophiala oligosperma TaxID=215243 RepID=A0A0D2APA4_9EURO|nr:uncharacterized protein PV06_05409 [Exophiala oligosperma]KIW41796.1 hypothetical protein PV06_05409 [Exophiala oligosperma]